MLNDCFLEKASVLRDYFCNDAELQHHHFNLEQSGLAAEHGFMSQHLCWRIAVAGEMFSDLDSIKHKVAKLNEEKMCHFFSFVDIKN